MKREMAKTIKVQQPRIFESTLGGWIKPYLRVLTHSGALMLLLALLFAQVMAAQTGGIRGIVVSIGPDGQPLYLAAAKVALRPESSENWSLATFTNDQGEFSYINLKDGAYALTAELAGFKPATQSVNVKAGSVAEIQIELELAPLTGEVTVTAEAETIDRTESSPTGTVKERTLQDAPLANERFQDALPLLPGVVRGPDGLINIKGARVSQSGYLINSTNVTDPVTGNFALNLPIDAIQDVQVLSSPYSAEYGRFTGAVTTVVTRQSGDDWAFKVQNILPRLRRRGGKTVGIEAATPRLFFGGPLIRNRLKIAQSFEYRFIRTKVESLPPLRNDTVLESFDSFSHVNLQLTPNHDLTVTFSLYPQKNQFVNLNTFNPEPVTPNFKQRGFNLAFLERAVFSNGSLLESLFSVKQFDSDVFPNIEEPMTLFPDQNFGGFFNRQDRDSFRYQWLELYHFPVKQWRGQQNLNIGVDVGYSTYTGRIANNAVRVLREDRTLAEQIDFFGNTHIERNNAEYSAFIQDKWLVTPKLTFDMGLRFERDGVAEDNNVAPRVGFVWVPWLAGHTAIRGGFGVFFDKIPLNVATFDQRQNRVVTRFAEDGVTGLDGPQSFLNLVDQAEINNPYSLAWSLEVDREITRKLLFRFGYQQREGRREHIVEPLAGPGDSGTLLLLSGGRSRYREFQFTARYKLSERSHFFASYVRSRATGDLNTFDVHFGNFQSPIIRPNERSRLSFDAPNRFLFWGDLQLPHDITASPVLEVRNGFPFSIVDEELDFIGRRNRAGRFPTFAALDLQVTKGLTIPFRGKKYKFRAGFKVFNLLNRFNPRDVQNNIGSPHFGSFFNGVERTFRGKFVFEF
ncbi:MAG: TonB-dependent receptor [Acidobacteria bacterium]|nr:TonB-dependent receptor [Acidobacteriota bacterium]